MTNRKRVGDRLVDVPAQVFACDFSDDPDPLARACAPEQPATVAVGQTWMRLTDGCTLPVKSELRCRSRGLLVSLGSDSLTIQLAERTLRREWVCTDAPQNVRHIG